MFGNVISLFSGVGGLDLGFEAAGFNIALTVEKDEPCNAVVASNCPHWNQASDGNVEKLSMGTLQQQCNLRIDEPTVLIGGPPCQPFSKSGQWVSGSAKKWSDPRSQTVNHFFRIMSDLLPDAVVIENVVGFVTLGGKQSNPGVIGLFDEVNRQRGTNYIPTVLQLNSADYGVPQKRKRVFIVAHKSGNRFHVPAPLFGEGVGVDESCPTVNAYRTAWDAIGDLDISHVPTELQLSGKWADLLPSIPEGSNYQWHTERGGGTPIFGWRRKYWSFLLKLSKSEPSWTIQASPGPATGPFHWRNRRLSVREMARIQTFPDWFSFEGTTYREATRQLGNAVPPALAEVVARSLASQYFGRNHNEPFVYQIQKNERPTRRHPTRRVPEKYLLVGDPLAPHPGTGKGPGARSRKINRTGSA